MTEPVRRWFSHFSSRGGSRNSKLDDGDLSKEKMAYLSLPLLCSFALVVLLLLSVSVFLWVRGKQATRLGLLWKRMSHSNGLLPADPATYPNVVGSHP
eukprot:scaffold2391_cov381-Prasinococcus_capsulatus_cf.AAC.5